MIPESIQSRRGRVLISGPMFRDLDLMAEVFAGFAVFGLNHDVYRDSVEVYAAGAPFEEISEGQVIPEYLCDMTRTDDGELLLEWRRVMHGGVMGL